MMIFKNTILLLLLSTLLFAQKTVVLDNDFKNISLDESIEYLEDSEDALSIEDLISSENLNFKSVENYINLGYSRSSFWVRFCIKSKTEGKSHPLWLIRANDPQIDFIDFYQVSEEGKVIKSNFSGNMRPVETRPRPEENIVFTASVPENETHTMYIRIKTESPVLLDFSLLNITQYLKTQKTNTLFAGLFIGVLLLAISYYSLLYYRIKDKSFLYLVLVGLALLLDFVATSQFGLIHLWPDMLFWNKISVEIFDALMVMFFIKFISEFLELHKYQPLWYKILNGAYYFFLALAAVVPFVDIFFISQLIGFAIIAVLLITTVVSYLSLRIGYKPAKFLFIGILLINPAGLSNLLIEFGIIPYSELGDKGYLFASVFLIWFFSQAVTDRVNLFKVEKEKAEKDLFKSEEQLSLIIKGADLGTWDWDIKNNKITYNKRRIQMTGYSPEEITNSIEGWEDSIFPEDQQKVIDRLNAHLRRETASFEGEYRLKHKTAGWIYVFDRGKIIEYNQLGKPVRATGTIADITVIKQVQEAALNTEKRYTTLFNTASDAIFLMKEEIIVECNHQTEKIFGCSREKIIGSTPYFFSPEKQPDGIKSKDKANEKIKLAFTGQPLLFEWKHKRYDGTLFDAEVSLNLMEFSDEIFLQAIVRDITVRKRAEHLLNVLNKAGIAVQNAVTTGDIFSKVSATLMQYGFQFTYFTYSKKTESFHPLFINYPKNVIKKAEKLAGIKFKELQVPKISADEFIRVTDNHEIVFVKNGPEILRKMLPNHSRKIAEEVAILLKLPAIILAPLITDDKVEGIISVHSNELQESDISAISVFVHQLSAALKRAQHFEQMQQEIANRLQTEIALKNSEEYFRSIIENSNDVILIIDGSGKVTYESPSHERVLGYPPGCLMGENTINVVHPEDKNRVQSQFADLQKKPGETISINLKYQHYDKTWRHIEGSATNLLHLPSVNGIVINYRDVSEGRLLQEQLNQSQKMEAVGLLAGGVAHDFNNLLTIISGYASLLLLKGDAIADYKNELEQIQDAGIRAEALTRQLLAFSRKQIVQPKIVDLNTIINDSLQMLTRLIGEDIQIIPKLGDSLPFILADPHQLEQILINLIVNARDAIHSNSTSSKKKLITVETRNANLDDYFCKTHIGSNKGAHLELVISDTGIGMEKQILNKIFEPFFTTKEVGKGTGLGLSTVYGIIKQNQGYVNVYSELQKGTTFKIYWPAAKTKKDRLIKESHQKIQGGSEIILLVEDDEGVRSFGVQALSSLGYKVQSAVNGKEALSLIKKKKIEPHLLITDMIMPESDGNELAKKVSKILPEIKIIFTSGYTDSDILSKGFLKEGLNFLEKPFSVSTLSAKVRKVLEAN